MKKRIVCVLLTLIMLVGMLPLSASAAGLSVSERAITVLKQLQEYSSACKQCGNEWRNGYGTICTRKGEHNAHTDVFNEGDADTALRAKLKELDAAVNASGLSLTQAQHDALVVFSYDVGTAWLSGTGVLKSAVSNGLTGNAFLNAIGQSADYGSDNTDNVTGWQRRMIEANMYLNGLYSNVAPSNYGYVDYVLEESDANMAEGTNGKYRQYFDAAALATPAPVPTRKGYIFLGWYMDNTWVSALASYQVGKTLVAKWQPEGASYQDATPVYNWLALNTLASKIIYTYPNSGVEAGVQTDEAVILDRDYIDSNGARWGRLQNGTGWVLVSGSAASSKFDIDVTVTVTNSTLNQRANASIFSAQNGTYKQGDQLRIISTANADGFLWGQVADADGTAIGWVALIYTNWSAVKDDPAASNSANGSDKVATAVINCEGYLNVRSDAGTDNAIVGALADGDQVDIFEIKFVNGHKWGRTTGGWILLTYAKVTMLDTNVDLTTGADVLAYTFTGTLKSATTAHTDVSHNSDTIGKELAAGTLVAVSMVKNDADGYIWGFNGTGWICLDNVDMDVAKYVVVSDSVTVRETASSSAASVEKIVKGVELDITEIAVVDATIWGWTQKYGGWVNLASKYVTRSNAPTIENVDSVADTGLIATVINTDSVRVRSTGATYGTIIGSLARGTTVKVWEGDEEIGWYKLDTNQNGTYDYDGDGWVSAQYLDVSWGTIGGDDEEDVSGSNSTSGSTSATVETGLGIVCNTYTGVNIRTGAGTGYASTGKYLNGTSVEILEVTETATAKWGRTAKGWVCMDYITMISNYVIGGTTTENTDSNAGQNAGGSSSNTEGNTTTSSTPAVYTGTVAAASVEVLKTADADAISVRTMNQGESVTIQELVKVTTKTTVSQGTTVDGNATTENTLVQTTYSYWARVNGGWIQDPATNLSLNPLDEIYYTVVNVNEVNVRNAANGSTIVTTIDKGTQVAVTTLQIVEDKVWGYVEDVGTSGGWIRLDNLSEGKITVTDETASDSTNTSTNTGSTLTLGVGSDTGGYVTNTSGYRYTGKVINTNEVNVRATPSTGANITTQLKYGASLVIYETTIAENMAWGKCDAGWVYLYYVDLVPVVNGAVDARVVYNDNTIVYTDANCSGVAGTYARMSVIDIYEIVGTMARTELGWVNINDLLS